MKKTETQIPGVVLFQSQVFHDPRGSFQELFNERTLRDAGIDMAWKQDNFSISHKNVVRGLHYQLVHPQAKLVQAINGDIFDVVVDLRRSSPTFGQHVSFELRAGDGQTLLIPAGCAHGFAVLESNTAVLYKVDNYYSPEAERTILWNDPELEIRWPVTAEEAILSQKDLQGKSLSQAEVFD
jgi:dTDP-4-dehydrorhamnose 3,5-epimerase